MTDEYHATEPSRGAIDPSMPGNIAHILGGPFQLLAEAELLKCVLRRSYVDTGAGAVRPENVGEHSWYVTLAAITLAPRYAPRLDIGRVVEMLLIHDLVEVDCGDTFVFDAMAPEKERLLHDREARAADRVFSLLPEPEGSKYRALWQEFNDASSPEGRFARALDALIAQFQHCSSQGRTWREHGITEDQAGRICVRVKQWYPELAPLSESIVDFAHARGWFCQEPIRSLQHGVTNTVETV